MNNNYSNSRKFSIELPEEKEKKDNISNTKVININDFIFHQNLEFYPNLQNLDCQDNTLIYTDNANIVKEVLTFDLRTLPGSVWTLSAQEFLNVIKMNKLAKALLSFMNILNEYAFDKVMVIPEDLEQKIASFMSLYFNVKETMQSLTEENKILISNIDTLVAAIPKDTAIGSIVNKKLDDYLELTKTMGDEKGKTMALVLKNKNLPSLIEEEPPVSLNKAGYVNIVILLYGLINIGMIVAMAIMK